MEQSSGSILTDIGAFSAHLPLIPLLWLSSALCLFVYFQVNTGVLDVLDYVEDICLVAPSDPPQTLNSNTLPLPLIPHLSRSHKCSILLNFYTINNCYL